MNKPDNPNTQIEGEETGAGFASPTLDLIASAVLIGIAFLLIGVAAVVT